jgi:hypothetical protein
VLDQVNAREPVIARLENWIVPESIINETTDLEDGVPDEDKLKLTNCIELYPNPVKSSSTFKYNVESTGLVELSLLDPQGRLVEILRKENRMPGTYHHDISVDHFKPGIYFYYRFTEGNYVEIGKLVIME